MVKKREPAGAAAQEFNEKGAAGAPVSPKLNRQQLITQVKVLLKKNASNGHYVSVDDESLDPTDNQKKLMKSVDERAITLVDGPFGTGKTIWTTLMALQGLADKKFYRIAITAPAVEAGENIGFLPGDVDSKMFPHVNQILEAFDDWVGKDLREQLQGAGVIKIEPHAFMRGRTIKKTFFILDESQNASGKQLMTSIARYGYGSTFVYMGDNAQNDRTDGDSAYVQFINRFTEPAYLESGYIGHVVMGASDVRRHPFLSMVVERNDNRPLEGYTTHKETRAVTVTPRSSKPQTASDVSGGEPVMAPA